MEKQLLIQPKNLEPSHSDFTVTGIFNPAAVSFGMETVLIARVAEQYIQEEESGSVRFPYFDAHSHIRYREFIKKDFCNDSADKRIVKHANHTFLSSISHFRIFRSTDGVHFDWRSMNLILPQDVYEEYGIEDPRITQIDDSFYITYTAISRFGINVRLMRTEDFNTFERLGNIFHSENKDCVIFPEKINGKYFSLHRPSNSQFGKLDIWTAESPDLVNWGNHKILFDAEIDYQDSHRIGAGAVPLLTEEGWLVIYHSADILDRYHLCAMVLDPLDPNRVLKRSSRPLVQPTQKYESEGFMNNVVFTCGALKHEKSLWIYYGVCDESIALCVMPLSEIEENMRDIHE